MATSTWDAFYNDVVPYAKGVALPMALNAIRNSAIDFCEQTRAWVYDHADVNIAAGTASTASTVTLTPPSGTRVLEVLQAFYSTTGRELYWKGKDKLARMYQDWQAQTSTTPLYMTELDLDLATVRLVPTPTTAVTGGFKNPILSLVPTRASTGIDTKLYEAYLEEICNGAIGRLLLTEGFPYSNPTLGAARLAAFRKQCNSVYNRVQRSLGRDTEIVLRR